MALPLPPPDFDYGEAYPGSIVPIVTNFAPRMWVPVSFGLIPSWAKDAKITRPERDQTSVVGGASIVAVAQGPKSYLKSLK